MSLTAINLPSAVILSTSQISPRHVKIVMLSAYDYTVSKRRLIFIIISANAGQFCKKKYFKFPRKFITQVLAITKIFTARCYASAVLAMALCPYVCVLVCVCVRLSQVGVLPKRLNTGSHKQHYTIA